MSIELHRQRLTVGQYLVFPKDADPTTDKTALFRVTGFDGLGRPRILVHVDPHLNRRGSRSVHKSSYHNYRVVGKEGVPMGELTDCMTALNAYWQAYPEDREKATGGKP